MSGHLREPNMMMPFSIDKLSLGRPATAHDLIVTSSPSTFFIVTPFVILTPSFLIELRHRVSSYSR